MTASLEKAFAKASDLPAEAQEQLAEQLLDDIDGEMKWDDALANSQELLEMLAQEARVARKKGKIVSKGFDDL